MRLLLGPEQGRGPCEDPVGAGLFVSSAREAINSVFLAK